MYYFSVSSVYSSGYNESVIQLFPCVFLRTVYQMVI